MAYLKTWTDEDIERAVVEACERSGVPRYITDPAVIAMFVDLTLPRAGMEDVA